MRVNGEERADNHHWQENLVKQWKSQRCRVNAQVVTHSWNTAFQLGRICFALTLEGCPNFMSIFTKAFLWIPSSNSSLSWKHDLMDLRDPWVQPVRPLAYTGAAAQGDRLQQNAANPSSHGTEDSQECSPCSIPHQKQTPQLTPHRFGNLRSLPLIVPFYGPQIQAGKWMLCPLTICQKVFPLNYSPRKVSFSVTRRKQGTAQLYFTPLLTWQRIHRFIFVTCGFICQSKHIKSNIGFDQDRTWGENDTFSQYFVDQKKSNNGCNFSDISSKWCGKRDQMMTDKINYVQQDQ